jgi:CheY-like chemotaxis protein
MTMSQVLASHIPSLRRFSRALTGSQSGGDAYVLATLEAIIADPKSVVADHNLKRALYRLFLKVWRSAPVNSFVDKEAFYGDEIGARRNLEAITLRPRIAFLLSALEGFETAAVADTLECSIEEAAFLIDDAARQITDQIRTDVLIIEDEPLIALDLENLVEELGHRVISVARTHCEAIKIAGRERPGLILTDVQLADGSSGLDAVNEIVGDFAVPVIVITGYPKRYLTGTLTQPDFLVTKPFEAESVKAIISQALFFDHKSHCKSQTFLM